LRPIGSPQRMGQTGHRPLNPLKTPAAMSLSVVMGAGGEHEHTMRRTAANKNGKYLQQKEFDK